MKIVYFYQYFSTPKGSWGTRVYEFTKNWVEQGHEVTVVSSIYSKSDLSAHSLIEDQYFEGIKVKVLNVRIDNKQSFVKRIFSFLLYTILSSWYAIRLPADVVIASSGPISVGIPGLIAHYVRGRKFIFEVRDLWPEGAIQLGIIQNKYLKKLGYWLERVCYRAAAHIITLSPGMQQDIESRFGISQITSVTNAANLELFGTPKALSHPSLNSKQYAIYTGNIGKVNNSEWLLEAARIMQERGHSTPKIILIGEGQQKEMLLQKADKLGLKNFEILNLVPKTTLVAYVQHALVSLVPLKGVPILDTSSPNKFFESLAAGVPIIQNTNGWMRDYLEQHEVGFTVDPNDPIALAELLTSLASNETQIKQMGINAKVLAEKQFDKDVLANKMLKAIKSVV